MEWIVGQQENDISTSSASALNSVTISSLILPPDSDARDHTLVFKRKADISSASCERFNSSLAQ